MSGDDTSRKSCTDMAESANIKAERRVKYSTGLVLGVDEFEQEQYFFLERDRLHQRGLHGYGVVCGLKVTLDDGLQVKVEPGLAATPQGQIIKIGKTQCGNLQEWLDQPDNTSVDPVHVLLCYRECETEKVPVSGAPCRSEDESVAPSRVESGFEIRFSAKAPAQELEDEIRRFGEVLAVIASTSDERVSTRPLQEVLSEARKRMDWPEESAGEDSEDEDPEKEESLEGTIWVAKDDFDAVMTALLDLWVEVGKGKQDGADADCAGRLPGECCILLASLTRSGKTREIDDSRRPVLLTTRMLQEYIRARDNQHPDHGDLPGLEDDDHPQYLLIDGSRSMEGSLSFAPSGTHKATGLHKAEVAGDAVTFEQAVLDGDPAGGDLYGTYPDPRVGGLRDVEIDLSDWENDRPAEGASLIYRRGTRAEIRGEGIGGEGIGGKGISTGGIGDIGDIGGIGGIGIDGIGVGVRLRDAWVAKLLGLGDLTDVNISSSPGPTADQVLVFNGAGWRNGAAPESPPTGHAGGDLMNDYPNPSVKGIRDVEVETFRTPETGQVMVMDLSSEADTETKKWKVRALGLGELSDVDPADAIDGQVLVYRTDDDGGVWKPGNAAGGLDGQAVGDLRGTWPDLTVTGICHRPICSGLSEGELAELEKLLGRLEEAHNALKDIKPEDDEERRRLETAVAATQVEIMRVVARIEAAKKVEDGGDEAAEADACTPKDRDVLSWSEAAKCWQRRPVREMPLVTLTAVPLGKQDLEEGYHLALELWFHPDSHLSTAAVTDLSDGDTGTGVEPFPAIQAYWEDGPIARRILDFVPERAEGNLFCARARLDEAALARLGKVAESPCAALRLRVALQTRSLILSVEGSPPTNLYDFMRERFITYSGADDSGETVTAYLRIPAQYFATTLGGETPRPAEDDTDLGRLAPTVPHTGMPVRGSPATVGSGAPSVATSGAAREKTSAASTRASKKRAVRKKVAKKTTTKPTGEK